MERRRQKLADGVRETNDVVQVVQSYLVTQAQLNGQPLLGP